ncbi:sulfite exporter TauE/SafE family protein [Halomonas sp. 18H]|uniref:sulfite exporter TauE/SafE family protein n=1 Tax=Halomonas almeriensis TaxID=308163 RepID=UPI0022305988|nr:MULTISPECIES: sulfite exporter TauE/SafE family protein [Halomonas]MCW4149230.1 sulfite exporter TauE/SafE family protein [Halomonas sp. 18H]MDN3552218.1 sulfite exporter TauE/SafE family protein [Halomonas almeriensis]
MIPLTAGLEPGVLLATLAIMAVAGYLHTVSGFGLGMIVMGAAGGLGIASVPVLAAVVSLVTLVNSAVALPGGWRRLDKRRVAALAVGGIPFIGLGVWALSWLNATFAGVLTLLLGTMVLYGGISIGLRPHPRERVSAAWTFTLSGALTGLCGGLFGVPGPPRHLSLLSPAPAPGNHQAAADPVLRHHVRRSYPVRRYPGWLDDGRVAPGVLGGAGRGAGHLAGPTLPTAMFGEHHAPGCHAGPDRPGGGHCDKECRLIGSELRGFP